MCAFPREISQTLSREALKSATGGPEMGCTRNKVYCEKSAEAIAGDTEGPNAWQSESLQLSCEQSAGMASSGRSDRKPVGNGERRGDFADLCEQEETRYGTNRKYYV